ncbi:MAG: hypothetical protein MUO77_18685 [Anaerolineales bacterium]|nr:hypothetical protein [Anaerolineales bacterium]
MTVPDTWMLGLPGGCVEDDPDDWSTLQSIMGEADMPIKPDDAYFPHSTYTDNCDGSRTAQGWIKVIWRFKMVTATQREALRDFCADLSAEVYLRTRTNEYDQYGERAWINLEGQLLWPPEDENVDGDYVGDLDIEFRACVEIV